MRKEMSTVVALVLMLSMVACTSKEVDSSSQTESIKSQSIPISTTEESSTISVEPAESLSPPTYAVKDVEYEGLTFQVPESLVEKDSENGILRYYFPNGLFFFVQKVYDDYPYDKYFQTFSEAALESQITSFSQFFKSTEFSDIKAKTVNGRTAYYVTGTAQGHIDESGVAEDSSEKVEFIYFSTDKAIYNISFRTSDEDFSRDNEYLQQFIASIHG